MYLIMWNTNPIAIYKSQYKHLPFFNDGLSKVVKISATNF